MITLIECLGLLAGTLTTFSFLPQIIKVWRTREVSSISLGMYSLFCLGVLLWLIYGLTLGSFSLILTNVVTLGFVLCILSFKVWFERKKES